MEIDLQLTVAAILFAVACCAICALQEQGAHAPHTPDGSSADAGAAVGGGYTTHDHHWWLPPAVVGVEEQGPGMKCSNGNVASALVVEAEPHALECAFVMDEHVVDSGLS